MWFYSSLLKIWHLNNCFQLNFDWVSYSFLFSKSLLYFLWWIIPGIISNFVFICLMLYLFVLCLPRSYQLISSHVFIISFLTFYTSTLWSPLRVIANLSVCMCSLIHKRIFVYHLLWKALFMYIMVWQYETCISFLQISLIII